MNNNIPLLGFLTRAYVSYACNTKTFAQCATGHLQKKKIPNGRLTFVFRGTSLLFNKVFFL